MPITITITDPTPEQIAALFLINPNTAAWGGEEVPAFEDVAPAKPRATRAKPAPKADPEPVDPEEAQLAAEIAADVAEAPPEPKGAQQIVDGGTGKPMDHPAERAMTMDEVRASATRLAQANAPELKAILASFGAAKLSEVKPDDLPDFAQAVLDALG